MSLPSVTTEEVSPVLVKLQASSDYADLFVLNAGAVSLADGALAKITSGSCPTESSIELSFELISQVLGSNEQSLEITVEAEESTEKVSAFVGVIIDTLADE